MTMRARLLPWLALLLLAASACSVAKSPTPLLWKVSDGDNAVYLLGSFHMLKPSDYPLAPAVDAAFDDAEKLAFEIAPEELASAGLTAKMLSAARLPPGRTLQQSVSPATWTRLEEYAARRTLPLDKYQGLEPWFVSLVIGLREMSLLEYDASIGLDRHLVERAGKAGKPSSGLETIDAQIAALDSMTPLEQQQSLSDSLDDAASFKTRIDRLHGLWRTADAAAMEQLMATEFKRDYAQLYQRVNVDRNQAWLPKIQRMLDAERSDDTLVVVGTLHLLGPDGLVSQLRSRGYRVQRL